MTLIRGAHPYVLVVDDIQKDAQPHEYEWVANVANDFHSVGYPTVEMIESSETTAVEISHSSAQLICENHGNGNLQPVSHSSRIE